MARQRRTVPVNSSEPDLATVVANLQRVPPVVPPVPDVQPEVQPEVPRNAEVPIAPVGVQVNPHPAREDLLYERFRRMKAPGFEGPTHPIAADNWLIDIQVILDFMRLTEQEKILCAFLRTQKGCKTLVDDRPNASRCYDHEVARFCDGVLNNVLQQGNSGSSTG
ncbi:hypothetical protein TIFTF001_032893 [Ficus carica]|uniref:Uncharacterized protein n=1 Tax=Ficus carica TaxID=3494 RepID=A0AA88J304_FICCA|nr:hypothetical protein TIFTF001_032893 [Ficus carica]